MTIIMNNRTTSSDKVRIILITSLLIFCLFCWRLVQLQIINQHDYHHLCQQNYTRFKKVPPIRGNILDCNGHPLATNRPVISLYWSGTGNYKLTPQQLETLATLESITRYTFLTSMIEKIAKAERTLTMIQLIPEMSLKHLAQIMEIFPEHKNITVKNHFKRFYPYKTWASHILGHIGQADFNVIGKMGLEKIAHPLLQGQHGQIITTINSKGTYIAQQELQSAMAGQDIVTTIDLNLQAIVEHLFPQEYAGTVIVMDPKTGDLKAIASYPNFDPTLFVDSIDKKKWEHIQDKKPFINRAFNACYPPASIFKLVTISAALELGLVNLDDQIDCKGYYLFKKRPYYCARRYGHGSLNLTESVAKSCNIVFFQIGQQIHIDQLAGYAYKFGLGQKTGIIFPEHIGLVPTTSWKLQEKGEPWWPGETLSAAIGQSYILVPPIQISCLIGSIFQGYRVRPRILKYEPIEQYPLDILKSTRTFLKKSMKSVVKFGTGKNVSEIEDIKIYAKTGTAQITSLLKMKKNPQKQHLEHAWFVAYFQYKDCDPLVLTVLIEHAGSSKSAVTFAKRFLMSYRSLMQQHNKEHQTT